MKEKHLEFILSVISRQASNSFLIKGWSITLVSAIFVLSAKDSNGGFALFGFFPALMFWILDGYFLFQEKAYRNLYGAVSAGDEKVKPYDLNAQDYSLSCSWFKAMFSKTLCLFHGVVVGSIFVVWMIQEM